ncbi:MAG: hypothetical protein J6W54_06510 [Fibrobacter sp.]|nr:hypothetical protein [Fibrobacter sp.]
MTMVNRNQILLLFCLTLLFCGCGGEKYMEHNDYTVVFDVRKDSIFIDGILYPDLYRELDANPQYETNPLYDIAIRRIEEKTRKLKEQGKCEKTYNGSMSIGKREINIEHCFDSSEQEKQVHVRVDGDVSGMVLREISQAALFVFGSQYSMVLNRDFHIPLTSSRQPEWASPIRPPSTRGVKCILKILKKQDSLTHGKDLTQDDIKKLISENDSLCKDEPEEGPETRSYMELSINYNNDDSVYYAFYNRRPSLKMDYRERLAQSNKPEVVKPEDLLKRMQQEYESKSLEEREYPISITVISDARVFEPLKAAEAALQSGLKVGFGFTY